MREVLRGLPFLQQMPEPLFDALLERGQLMGEPGSLLLNAPLMVQYCALDT